MYKMVFISVILILVSCQPKVLPTIMVSDENLTYIKLSHQSTKAEMSEFSKAIALDQGITMDFSKSVFFEDGRLRKLILSVICPDNTGGKTSADLTTLQFKYYGFLYQKNGNPVFKIGIM